MDKYHIYDEIGKGDFSQIFKGREKKKIEYVAIKRVDKSKMEKVLSVVSLQLFVTKNFQGWFWVVLFT